MYTLHLWTKCCSLIDIMCSESYTIILYRFAQYPFVTSFFTLSLSIQRKGQRGALVLSTWGFMFASYFCLPPLCLDRVLIVCTVREEEKKRFSTRVSLATLSACTQSKAAAGGMIYLVKRDSLLTHKGGL